MSAAQSSASNFEGIRLAETAGGRLYLFLNNSLAALEGGHRRIRQHFGPEKLAPRVINRLEVVFEEVVANIIRHGLIWKPDQLILVIASALPDAIELVFEDEGVEFNPLDVPSPKPFETLEETKVGGLGVHLVRQLSTAVAYERIFPGDSLRWVGQHKFCPSNRLIVSIARS